MLSSLVSLELSFFHLAKQDQNTAFTGNCNRRLHHHAHNSVLNGLVDPCAYYVIYCHGLKQKSCSICSLSYNKNTVGYARINVNCSRTLFVIASVRSSIRCNICI